MTIDELKTAMPCGTTFSRNVHKLAAECRQRLKEILKTHFEQNSLVAFTTDIWQDKYKRVSFLSLTAHYYDRSKNDITDLLLAIHPLEPGRTKDYQYVRTVIESKLAEYEVMDYTAQMIFVTDRGGNIKKALKDYVRLNCFPHFIHSILKNDDESEVGLTVERFGSSVLCVFY